MWPPTVLTSPKMGVFLGGYPLTPVQWGKEALAGSSRFLPLLFALAFPCPRAFSY